MNTAPFPVVSKTPTSTTASKFFISLINWGGGGGRGGQALKYIKEWHNVAIRAAVLRHSIKFSLITGHNLFSSNTSGRQPLHQAHHLTLMGKDSQWGGAFTSGQFNRNVFVTRGTTKKGKRAARDEMKYNKVMGTQVELDHVVKRGMSNTHHTLNEMQSLHRVSGEDTWGPAVTETLVAAMLCLGLSGDWWCPRTSLLLENSQCHAE